MQYSRLTSVRGQADKQPSGHPHAHPPGHPRLASVGGQADKHAYSTPEVGWKKKANAKPASAPEWSVVHKPQSRSRLKQRSAPR